MIWLLLTALAFGGELSATAYGPRARATITITLVAHVSPRHVNNVKSKPPPGDLPPPPPSVLVNQLAEPIERYYDRQNRGSVARIRGPSYLGDLTAPFGDT